MTPKLPSEAAPEVRPDSWALLAALVGFLSGAGVMSHADLVHIFSEEFFHFMHVPGATAGTIQVFGREMILILVSLVAYLLLLGLLFVVAVESIMTRDRLVTIAGCLLLLLSVSFLSMSAYSINRGYYDVEAQLRAMHSSPNAKGTHVKWVWK
jgi:hypothetical protein